MSQVLDLHREKGRKITVEAYGDGLAFIVWRKNGSPLLPLVLSAHEGELLREMLKVEIARAAVYGLCAPAKTEN